MKDWDDEIHRALAHPIRRHILECLQENDLSFRELMRRVAIVNHGKLGFHIRALKGLVEHDPSTKKYRLTDRGQLAGELIWDIRFMITRGGRDLAIEPTRYVRRLRFGDHAILFYDTEDVKREISFSFLKAGLLKGEAVVYVVSEHKLDSERREIQRYGISADHFRKEAFTIMSADEWYLKKGKAQAKTIIANWQKLLKEKQKAGFTGLRGAIESEVFFNYTKVKELLRYEAALGRQLALNLCGLCLYDTHRLDEEQFIQLNKSHGHAIFKGIALKTL
ncbi:MAG: MEDS domain-containing protein [Candidatus Bathyarchaeia archaeon]